MHLNQALVTRMFINLGILINFDRSWRTSLYNIQEGNIFELCKLLVWCSTTVLDQFKTISTRSFIIIQTQSGSIKLNQIVTKLRIAT